MSNLTLIQWTLKLSFVQLSSTFFHSLFYMMIDDDSLWVCETLFPSIWWWRGKEWKLSRFFFFFDLFFTLFCTIKVFHCTTHLTRMWVRLNRFLSSHEVVFMVEKLMRSNCSWKCILTLSSSSSRISRRWKFHIKLLERSSSCQINFKVFVIPKLFNLFYVWCLQQRTSLKENSLHNLEMTFDLQWKRPFHAIITTRFLDSCTRCSVIIFLLNLRMMTEEKCWNAINNEGNCLLHIQWKSDVNGQSVKAKNLI